MTHERSDIESDEGEEDLGPSLAYPGLYVLRSSDRCPECGVAQHVYSVGCERFGDAAWKREPINEFHFLRTIKQAPQGLLEMLKARAPSFFIDRDDPQEAPHLMNHCPCGVKLDDDLLHGDVGASFWPDTPDGFGCIKPFRLRIDDPIEVVCGYAVGGGEYLRLAQAEWW